MVLYGLLVLPLILGLFIIAMISRRKKLSRFAATGLHDILIPQASRVRIVLKFILLMFSLAFLIIALAGPRVGSKLQEVEKKGREIIIALDVSNSMLAEDIKPNRLEKAKESLNRLLNDLGNDRIGLIVFAGDAYTQIPVTTDYGAARLFLNSVTTEMVSKQGTSISSAIALATRSFSPDPAGENPANARNKALIIITDGENHEDDPVSEAMKAAEKGILIHTIGLGDPAGVPVPMFAGSNAFRRDKEGNVVVSKLDETTLKQIASVGNGFYVRAGSNSSGLNQLMQKLDEMETQEFKTKVFAEYIERFQYFLGAGILLLILEFLVMSKKNPWLERIRLFKAEKSTLG
ncbi:MAG: VWA domain-containing protein [Bacteroidales bacterium]|nr:VWA domain-containing protein [Bacteroidales bacterium]